MIPTEILSASLIPQDRVLDCIFISTWDPVLDRGVEMCEANVNREYVKITTPSQTYRLDCPIPCHVHQSI